MPSDDLITSLRAALDSAEQQARQATPGPWRVDDESYAETIYGVDDTAVLAGGRWGGEASVFESTEDALFIAVWNPARVLKLVERDRALLAGLDEAQKAMDRAVLGFGLGDVFEGELIAVTARLKALREGVKRAAEFWLGEDTPK